jgi:hypothetical protein
MSIFFKNTADFKKFYNETTINTDFETLIRPLTNVTELYIEPYLGAELTAELATIATATTEPTGTKEKVINTLKSAISDYYLFHELPKKTFSNAPAGARISTGEHGTGLTLPQIKFQQAQAIRRADAFLNRALKLITQNLEDFENFKPNIETGSQFFPSAEVFENYSTAKGFKAFALMSHFLRRVENDEVLKILGSEFLAEFKNTPNTNISMAALVPIIRHFVSAKALYIAIPYLNFIIDGDGLKILSATDGEDTRAHIKDQNEKLLKALKEQCEKDAAFYKSELLTHLFKYANDFPTWKTSAYYIANSATPITKSTIITQDAGAIGFFRK